MHISRLYTMLSRFQFLSYRAKIMLVAFLSTHVPLIALVFYLALGTSQNRETLWITIGVALIATLIGTAFVLCVLQQLLQPVLLTSNALRRYRETREKTALPTGYTDEVGALMADAHATIDHLEQARDTLEHFDEITSLPNRRKLLQIMNRRAGLELVFTVCVIRFSNFSRIVESVDMTRANQAAGQLADRLEALVAPGGIVARIGPSDFALLYDQRHGDDNAWLITIDRLHALINQASATLSLGAIDVKPDLLCGVAAFPTDAGDAQMLLDHAIAAAAQASHSSPVVVHSAEARRAAFKRLTIEQQLRRALDNNEFVLNYQPVIDFENGRVTGAEALIRWQKPDQGLVFPAEFIPAAEASGLITPIGRWVMQQTCQQLREWRSADLDGFGIAINLSARQFLDPHLTTDIAKAIEDTGVEAHRLELELTETAAMQDVTYTRQMLSKLRDLGVTIAIDDFGTGYASMSYLKNLPFDKLKIAREFVTDVHEHAEGQAICRSIIALSQGLGLDVLAEGTEKAAEVRYLRSLGCRLFQGFYFAKPLSAAKFADAYHTLPRFLARPRGATRRARVTALFSGS